MSKDIPDWAPLCAAPDPHPRAPRRPTPPNAADCHAHICGPLGGMPYDSERIYTPPDALLPDYRAMLDTLGIRRAVLVQPSVYGTDNRVMLQALHDGGPLLRGVAVVSPDISDVELQMMHVAGVRGVRFNCVDRREGRNTVPVAEIAALAERIKPLGWHVEFLLQVDAAPDLEVCNSLPVDIVFGHLGYVHADRGGADDTGFRALLKLMERGRCWVKLTGPYRISAGDLPYADVAPMARALAAAAPERLVWGSDWPHVMVRKPMPNDGALLDLLADWVPDDAVRRRILVDNPVQLYGFPE
jgi:predicted TIM-barrel fold metal-dependent hydrolase